MRRLWLARFEELHVFPVGGKTGIAQKRGQTMDKCVFCLLTASLWPTLISHASVIHSKGCFRSWRLSSDLG